MKKTHVLLVAGLCAAVVTGLLAYFVRAALTVPIKTVIIHSPFPLRYTAAKISSSSLLLLDTSHLRSHLLQMNRDSSNVIIEKSYPDTLVLTVMPRKPIAWVRLGSQRRYIDEDGILLTYSPKNVSEMPFLDAPGIPFYANQKADWRIATAIVYVKLFRQEQLPAFEATIDVLSSHYRFLLSDSTIAIVPFSSDPGAIVASLQVILGRFRIEGKKIHTVDFQFAKPIITFQNGEKISS